MKEQITEYLVDIFDKIGIQTPINFDEIEEFVTTYIYKYAVKNNGEYRTVTYEDVAWAFKLWIQSNE